MDFELVSNFSPTGDQFRRKLRQLVNGLNDLESLSNLIRCNRFW